MRRFLRVGENVKKNKRQTENSLSAGLIPDDVLVIGAGASGMMAAIFAAREGARVRILEKMKKPGRKLLLTGNGRCNLTHWDENLSARYHCVSRSLSGGLLEGPVFMEFGFRETLRFFEEIGLMTQNRDGYIYPRSGQAQSVLNVLMAELERLSVRLKYDTEVTGLEYDKVSGSWMALTKGWAYPARQVILSCGSRAGMSAEKQGEHTDPLLLVKKLGHTVIEPWPALTAMHCPDPDLRFCEGARTRARVTLMGGELLPNIRETGRRPLPEPRRETGGSSNREADVRYQCQELIYREETGDKSGREAERAVRSEEGELQWTASELSGIPVFQLSRFAYGLSEHSPMAVSIDFLPDVEETLLQQQLEDLICRYQIDVRDKDSLVRLMTGFVHDRIAAFLVRKAAAEPSSADLAAFLKRLALPVDGVRDFSRAQICIGGVPLYEVKPDTLESTVCPGLFLSGEVLDIDGPCGGYNLQWAWSSGAAAGRAAGRRTAGKEPA